MVEDEPRDPVKNSTRPLEPELVKPNDPVRVLKSDVCSVKVEETPIEPEKLRGNPLVSELAREIELVRVLKSEMCSAVVEAEPREPDRLLKSEVCSARPADEPTVPVKNSTAPLNRVVPRPSDPASDLPIPLVS